VFGLVCSSLCPYRCSVSGGGCHSLVAVWQSGIVIGHINELTVFQAQVQLPRLTRPSTLHGMLKWISAF